MIRTITNGTIFTQGKLVKKLPNGRAVVEVFGKQYTGKMV
jgi:hypothetical protein